MILIRYDIYYDDEVKGETLREMEIEIDLIY